MFVDELHENRKVVGLHGLSIHQIIAERLRLVTRPCAKGGEQLFAIHAFKLERKQAQRKYWLCPVDSGFSPVYFFLATDCDQMKLPSPPMIMIPEIMAFPAACGLPASMAAPNPETSTKTIPIHPPALIVKFIFVLLH